MPLRSPSNLKSYMDRRSNGLSDDLSEKVLFGHPSGCPCCRSLPNDDGTKIGELQLANDSEESLFAGVAASNQTLADYLRSGFWIDFGSSARKFISATVEHMPKMVLSLTTPRLIISTATAFLRHASFWSMKPSSSLRKFSESIFSRLPTSMLISVLETQIAGPIHS